MDIPSLLAQLLDYVTGGLTSAAAVAADRLWALLNSNFSAALAGAGAGAYAAHWIAKRSERKLRLSDEVRATNASINLAFSIANTFLNVKAQHVRRLVDTYKAQRAQVMQAHQNQPVIGQPAPVIAIFMDFQTLSPPATDKDVLQQLLFEKVSLTGRPLLAFTTLTQAIGGVSEALEARNEWIAECKANPPPSIAAMAQLYFGLPQPGGKADEQYPSLMRAISSQTDDCIFFSKLLMEDLVRHGKSLADKLGKEAPKIHEPDFSKAAKDGLIPDDAEYEGWLSGFKPSEPAIGELTWIAKLSEALGDG